MDKFKKLPGSAGRFQNLKTGEEISRRQRDKLLSGGKTREQRQKERRAAAIPLRQKKTRVGVIERAKRAIRAILRGVLPTKAVKQFKTTLPTIRRQLTATSRRFERGAGRRLRIESERVLRVPVPSSIGGYKQVDIGHLPSKQAIGIYSAVFEEWRLAVDEGKKDKASAALARFNEMYPKGVTVKTVDGKLIRLPDFDSYLAAIEAFERDHGETVDKRFYIPKLAA